MTVFRENSDSSQEIVQGEERDRYFIAHNRQQLVQARMRGDLDEYTKLAKKVQTALDFMNYSHIVNLNTMLTGLQERNPGG